MLRRKGRQGDGSSVSFHNLTGIGNETDEPSPCLVYLGLGSNTGDREENLRQATRRILVLPEVVAGRASALYETEPWGEPDQGYFLNQVLVLQTWLNPRELLTACQQIEMDLGRIREKRWGPRIIDIDILLYGDKVVQEEDLNIPHPYLTERLFVLIPLAEIAPGLVLPGGKVVEEVLREAHRWDHGSITKL